MAQYFSLSEIYLIVVFLSLKVKYCINVWNIKIKWMKMKLILDPSRYFALWYYFYNISPPSSHILKKTTKQIYAINCGAFCWFWSKIRNRLLHSVTHVMLQVHETKIKWSKKKNSKGNYIYVYIFFSLHFLHFTNVNIRIYRQIDR